jgi:hypothetical protein
VGEPNNVIREYDPAWQGLFEGLRGRLLDVLSGLAVAVEHVGSTAVPGLAAKPIVDIDAVVASAEDVPWGSSGWSGPAGGTRATSGSRGARPSSRRRACRGTTFTS